MAPRLVVPSSPKNFQPRIIVHGGAWAIPESLKAASLSGVTRAAALGQDLLNCGHSALDAVEAAIRALEDDEAFDAGRGSCLNSAGGIEMDAAVMIASESDIQAGGIAAISNVRNPICVARAVATQTEHVLLVGQGADAFAEEIGIAQEKDKELVQTWLRTPAAVKEWEEYQRYKDVVTGLFNGPDWKRDDVGSTATFGNADTVVVPPAQTATGCDTVGAVAIDVDGTVAAGTSTGGITCKRVGRVGDSPVIGAGLYADVRAGACSSTGHGESILKVTLARYAVGLMEQGVEVKEAGRMAVKMMKEKTGGCGGLILVDKMGRVAKVCSTKRMAWACTGDDGRICAGIEKSESDWTEDDVERKYGLVNGASCDGEDHSTNGFVNGVLQKTVCQTR